MMSTVAIGKQHDNAEHTEFYIYLNSLHEREILIAIPPNNNNNNCNVVQIRVSINKDNMTIRRSNNYRFEEKSNKSR